ncbi:MAG: HAMP domain-containing sensor histidine kinase [Thermoanaerobaculia bacterium]
MTEHRKQKMPPPPDDQRREQEQVGRSRKDAAAAKEERENRFQTVASVRAEFEALTKALREANGHLVMANLRSQTLAEQMNELYEEARRAIQAKDDFFSTISHELRTPLTSIKGWADLLAESQDVAIITEAARSIAASAATQARLIDDLLDVSRIMTNKFAIAEARLDLATVIDASVSGIWPIAMEKGVSLRKQVTESVFVQGDEARLSQVLSNLLTNAIRFTPADALIEIRLSREGSFGIIDVSDTGEGISAEFLPSVFDRRAQATERRFAGLGLGLTIVKHIVELHRGSVTVRSEGEGKGATFTVRIPSLT